MCDRAKTAQEGFSAPKLLLGLSQPVLGQREARIAECDIRD